MFSIPLPGCGRAGTCCSRRSGPASVPSLQVALLAAACLVPLVLIAWLYRYELQLVPRLAACFPAVHAGCACSSCCCSSSCLQPVVAQSQIARAARPRPGGRGPFRQHGRGRPAAAAGGQAASGPARCTWAGDVCSDDQLDAVDSRLSGQRIAAMAVRTTRPATTRSAAATWRRRGAPSTTRFASWPTR